MVEPGEDQLIVVPTGVPHAPLTHHRVFLGPGIGAVGYRRHHGELVVPGLVIDAVLPHMVEKGQVRPDGDVVPGHEPEARNAERFVVVVESAPVPRAVIGGPLDHTTSGCHRSRIGEDAFGPIPHIA